MLGFSFTRLGNTVTIMLPYVINTDYVNAVATVLWKHYVSSFPCFCMLSVSRSKRRRWHRGDRHYSYWLIFDDIGLAIRLVSFIEPVIFYSECGFNYLERKCLVDDLSRYLSIIEVRPFLLFGCCHLVLLTPFGAILHKGNWKLELQYRGTAKGRQLLVLTFVPHLLNIIMKLISHKNVQGRLAR